MLLDRLSRRFAARLLVTTDDGSLGKKGFVAQGVARKLLEKKHYADSDLACGPENHAENHL